MGDGGAADTVVIGLGNEDRRDDRCGLDVIRALRQHEAVPARILEGGEDATELLDLWADARRAIVVDAMVSGRPAGTVQRFEIGVGAAPSVLSVTSTHGLSVGDAIGLARHLGRLPPSLVVFG